MTSSTEARRWRRSSSGGSSNGTRAAARERLAREILCATVDSWTRKARAISSVDSPPRSRSVSATRESGDSTGWHAMKMSRSRSSLTTLGSLASPSSDAARVGSFCSRVRSRRMRSTPRRLPTAISHAAGLRGTPVSGHCSSAATSASWAMSSATPTSPTDRASPAMSRAASIRHTASISRRTVSAVVMAFRALKCGRLDPGRFGGADLGWDIRLPGDLAQLDKGVTAERAALRPLHRLVLRGAVDDPEPAHDLLGLGERTVLDGGHGAVEVDASTAVWREQAVDREQDTRLAQLLVVAAHRGAGGVGTGHPLVAGLGDVGVDKHEKPHGRVLLWCGGALLVAPCQHDVERDSRF